MDDALVSNLFALLNCWKRHSFHEQKIESIRRLHEKVVITMDNFYLVFIGVTHCSEVIEAFPTSWISQRGESHGNHATVAIEVEFGKISLTFMNLRLIRRSDLAILIPSLDAT